MIEAAEADVVGPAVAADDPHALAHQRVGDRQQLARSAATRMLASFCFSSATRSRCAAIPASVDWSAQQ